MASSDKKDAAPATETTTPSRPQLKLLVDQSQRRVLYAEAHNDAVDFLLGLLRLPAGLAARVLDKHAERAPGALGALYASARSLGEDYLLPAAADRDALISPTLPSAALPILDEPPPPPPPPPVPKRYFRCAGYTMPCRGNPTHVTDVGGVPCPACRQPMSVEMRWVPGDSQSKLAQAPEPAGEGGYVKRVVTYLVMDNLKVIPMSTISAITLLKEFDVKDLATLQELTVDLGLKEGVKLLKASLESPTVLTDVFVQKSSNGGVSIDRLH